MNRPDVDPTPWDDRSAEEVRRLRALSHADYLLSDHWQLVRVAALEWGERRCVRCGAIERLNVHHRSYERKGCELRTDLEVLCKPCHEFTHRHLIERKRRKTTRPTGQPGLTPEEEVEEWQAVDAAARYQMHMAELQWWDDVMEEWPDNHR